MLYLFIGAVLIIAAKAQTLTECTSDSDCSALVATPKCAVDALVKYCVPCLEDSDCTGNAIYSGSGLDTCVVTAGLGQCTLSSVSGCSTASDCSTGQVCVGTVCYDSECSEDSDCTDATLDTCTVLLGVGTCTTGSTVSGCSEDSDCSTGQVCYLTVCYDSECSEDSDCTDATLDTCTVVLGVGTCTGSVDLSCTDDSDCSTGFTCTNSLCTVSTSGCSSDSDCTVEGFGACYTSTSTCVACNSDDDCTGSSFYTNLGYTSCVGVSCTAGTVTGGCSTDDDCTSDLLPVCYGGTGNSDGVCSVAATACSSADDCESGESCISSVCIAIDGACSSDTDCEDDEACLIGFCQATDCTTDDDCSGEGESCTTVSSVKLCTVGCTSDADCDDSGEICGTIDGLSGGACFEEGTDGVTTYSDDVQQLSAIIGMIIMTAAGLFM